MSWAVAIIVALVGLVWGAVVLAGRILRKRDDDAKAKAIVDVWEREEREKSQLTDPDKTPTPLESQNAFRVYRDSGRN